VNQQHDTSADTPAYAVPEHVLHRRVDGQMVLLDLDDERYFGLDAIGADIVARLTAAPFDEAMRTLIADYEVDPDVLRSDIDELLGDLLRRGLVERVEGHG
jgi:hypothetical protein